MGNTALGNVSVEQTAVSEYSVTVVADKAFLEAESTVYPVVVDPSLTITPTTSYIDDATLSATNTTTNYGSSTTMFIGGANKGYIAMRFYELRSNSVFTSLAVNQILSADLNLSCGSKRTSAAIYAKQYKPTETSSQYWTETGITYAANGVVTEGTGCVVSC